MSFDPHSEPLYLDGRLMVTGRSITSQFGMAERQPNGLWRLIFDMPHVAWGKKYECIGATGVLDDFGSIVLVAGDNGAVVLS